MAQDLLNGDIRRLIKTLYQISTDAKGDTKRILEIGSRPIVTAARAAAPVGAHVHFRYNTPKLTKKLRAPNGMGVIVATYRPGNLRDSIKAIFFRRAANSVFIGPVVSRKPKGTFGPDLPFTYDGGSFASTRTDGFYAAWNEFGAPEAGISPNPFMRPAAASAGGTATKIVVNELEKSIQRFAKKYAQIRGRE